MTVALTGLAKERGLPVVLVGHVTKDGSIAGPRVLEHLVDVVLSFEGDKHSTLRMVRGVKNRFGPADEVGCFELRDEGIVGMADPSGLFLARFGGPPVPGTAVTVVMDGRRPLPAEVQALVAGKDIPSPRRAVSGLDNARVAMLLAVLETPGGRAAARRRGVRGDGRRDADHRAGRGPRPGAGDHLRPPRRRAAAGPRRARRDRPGGRDPPGGRGRAAAGRGGAAGLHPRAGAAGQRRASAPDLRVQEVGDVALVLDNLR